MRRPWALGAGLLVFVVGMAWARGLVEAAVAVRICASAIAFVMILALLDLLPDALTGPDEFDVAVARARAPRREIEPPERAQLRALVRSATEFAGAAHHRLRPLLRDLADARHEAAFGSHLDDPRAPERLGPAWPWVRPDPGEPLDQLPSGPTLLELDAIITALEGIATTAEEEGR